MPMFGSLQVLGGWRNEICVGDGSSQVLGRLGFKLGVWDRPSLSLIATLVQVGGTG